MGSLDGKVALVTGGGRGIGRAICLALAADGARVAVNDVVPERAMATAAELAAHGASALATPGDVSNAAEVEAMVSAATQSLGPILILVNNAALLDVHKPWQQISEAEWDRVMAVNLRGPFLLGRAVYPAMQAAHWGRIVNISSVTFWLGQANLLHYVSSKGGLIGFTRTLAREVGADGITVNAVTPGAIQTEAELEMFPDQIALSERMDSLQSIKRRGVAEDVAAAVRYLVSQQASFVTGQTLNVDGGWAMH